MNDKDTAVEIVEDKEEVEFFDPYRVHFISQNNRNDFLSTLEDDRSVLTYSTVH